MPPKKNQPNDKNKAKKSAKAVDDKTFGLKNKNKSKKVQQYVSQVNAQHTEAMKRKTDADQERRAAEKKAAEEAKAEAAKLFGSSVTQQKIPVGVDPKSILCAFFKKGVCTKGKRCKFSHDINVERKAEKRDLYSDERKDEKDEDTMDKWDEAKLRSVILSKHGNPKSTTDKVCKFFIEAVENGKYGWFWVCPNGGNECMYRHSLPPGFELKTKEQQRLEKMAAENAPQITLEEFIQNARDQLPKTGLTPITVESFATWKVTHRQKRLNDQLKEKQTQTGKEYLLRKLQDKFYNEDEAANGSVWDLSEFRKAMKTEDKDEDIKDYGDGTDAFADAQTGKADSAVEK